MRPSLRADLALLGVSIVWGATFPVMKIALVDASPLVYLVLRFLVALSFCVPLLGAFRARPSGAELAAGACLGLLLAGSFASQTLALRAIEPARSAFLTSLYVIFVPVVSIPVLRRAPRAGTWAGVVLALSGLLLMTWEGSGPGFRTADLMTIGSALGFALHIVGVGWLTLRYAPDRLFVLQIAAATVFLAVLVPLEVPRLVPSGSLVLAVLITGGLATAAAFLVQNRVQRRTSPSRAALVFALEPVFALLASVVLMGRTGLSPGEAGGALLIVTGLLVAEAHARRAEGKSSFRAAAGGDGTE